jgi:uncharacterized protein YjbI with pentapeptide repeats
LLDKDRPLRQPKANCEARTAAQVGTLTTLERIQNPDKKGIIVKFLWGCRLLEKQDTVVILEEANLEGADLGEAKLIGANLRKVHLGPLGPDLRRTKSERAKLGGAQLFDADLSGADLRKVLLRGADLSGAKLAGANLEEADMSNANLEEAVLSNANLRGANLKGAIMPNGQKYED